MANKVFIDFYNPMKNLGRGGEDSLVVPLNDDVLIDLQSEFQSVGDMIPSDLSNIISLIRKGQGASQSISPELEKLLNIPFWTKTNPLRLNIPLLFYLKDDVIKDVFEPAMGLASTSIINIINGKWQTPGISIKDAVDLKSNANTATTANKLSDIRTNRSSIIISLEIPGMIYLPYAIVYNAKPSFSKDVVRSFIDNQYYPIYARVDLEVRSLYPANTNMLKQSGGFKI